MNNQLQIVNNQQFGQVRWVRISSKDYAVGKDIAKCLGYVNPRDAISRHCKGVVKHDSYKEGGQCIALILEGDIYRLIVNSKLPGAEKFEKWVFDEVLPSIRKTGSYQVEGVKAREDKIYEELMQLPNDDLKNFTVNRMLDLLGISNKSIKQKVEMSENAFRDLVVEFMNENDVFIKRHKQGLIIDKDTLYKYFSQYGWTEHDVLETLDKYKMIYHKGEDRTYQITIDGKRVRTLIIQ